MAKKLRSARLTLTTDEIAMLEHALAIGVVDGSLYGSATGKVESDSVNAAVDEMSSKLKRAARRAGKA